VLSLDAQNCGIVFVVDYKRVVLRAVVWSGMSLYDKIISFTVLHFTNSNVL
jgi:hypothetical protein